MTDRVTMSKINFIFIFVKLKPSECLSWRLWIDGSYSCNNFWPGRGLYSFPNRKSAQTILIWHFTNIRTNTMPIVFEGLTPGHKIILDLFRQAECVNPTNVRRSESISNLSTLTSSSSLSTYRPLSGIRQYTTASLKRSPPSLQVSRRSKFD